MKQLLLPLIVAIFGAANLFAQDDTADVWRQNGKPIADSDARKTKAGFGAEMALTTDLQFYEEWKKPDPPVIDEVKTVMRSVAFDTILIFVDPGTDKSGTANVTADITVRKPDGSVYAQQKDVVAWSGKYSAVPHILELSQSSMHVRIDPGDPLGAYTVEVVVKDHNKNVELPLKTSIEVKELDYDEWFTSYYKSKDPTAFPGFLDYLKDQKLFSKEDSAPPMCAFVGTILREHPEFIAKYFPDISAFPEDEQKAVENLLLLSNTKEALAVVKKSKFKDDPDAQLIAIPEKKEVEGPSDLDICWGYFFASGDVNGLHPIITALDFGKYTGSIDAYKTSKKTAEDQKKAWLEATWRAAMWSLESNARQHPPVMQYLEDQLRGGKLSKDETAYVGFIMSRLKPDKYKIDVSK